MLLRATEESETRTLTIIGVVVVACAVLIGAFFFVFKPFGGRDESRIAVAISTPYVGQGVSAGSAMILHGVEVGEVTAVSSLPQGGVRLDTEMQARPVAGLTDTMQIDFRPANYFGVTGVNLIAGEGGQPLLNGMAIATTPKGNFALQVLLSRLGEISDGLLTPKLIQVIEWATRYTDGLDPLIETMMIAANAVAETQTVSTERLLRNATGLSVVFPSFVDQATEAGDGFSDAGLEDVELFNSKALPTMDEAQVGLFGTVGKLEYSHVADLLPAVNSVQTLSDVMPALIKPEGVAGMLVDLRTRLEKLYGGTPEQRALQVKIVLESLPGVASAVAAPGGVQ